jgi:hypothetical protein
MFTYRILLLHLIFIIIPNDLISQPCEMVTIRAFEKFSDNMNLNFSELLEAMNSKNTTYTHRNFVDDTTKFWMSKSEDFRVSSGLLLVISMDDYMYGESPTDTLEYVRVIWHVGGNYLFERSLTLYKHRNGVFIKQKRLLSEFVIEECHVPIPAEIFNSLNRELSLVEVLPRFIGLPDTLKQSQRYKLYRLNNTLITLDYYTSKFDIKQRIYEWPMENEFRGIIARLEELENEYFK